MPKYIDINDWFISWLKALTIEWYFIIDKLFMPENSIYKLMFWNESDKKTERSQIIIFLLKVLH